MSLEEAFKAASRSPAAGELRWTLLGQSYGGYISLTYLSTHPEGLKEVFITGGLPPCDMSIDDYFRIEYGKLVKESQEFFSRYPDDEQVVRDVLRLISDIGPENIRMTGRGYLTGQKLLHTREAIRPRTGFEEVHSLLARIKSELGGDGPAQSADHPRIREHLAH